MMTHATHTDHACIQSGAAACLDSEHITPFLSLSLFSLAQFDASERLSGWKKDGEREQGKKWLMKDGETIEGEKRKEIFK